MNSNTRKNTNFNFTQFMWTKTNLRSKPLRVNFVAEACSHPFRRSQRTQDKKV